MRFAGQILIALGFFAAALISVQTDANRVSWALYVPALLLGFVGVILGRGAAHRDTRDVPALQENTERLQQSLESIVANLRALDAESALADLTDLHHRIDQLFRGDLTTFVENRAAIHHRFGMQEYARIMNHFAAGERYLNRVWSASVDGYIDEARSYLTHARTELELASQHLNAVSTRKGPD